MTQKEEKEWLPMAQRFKDICCLKMCKSHETCISLQNSDTSVLNCPWFFNYRLYGWPYIKPSQKNYNAKPLPDLRVDNIDDEKLKEWLD